MRSDDPLFVCWAAGYDLQRNKECILENMCPRQCRCIEGVVDCRDKRLTHIPDNIPESATEMSVCRMHLQRSSRSSGSSGGGGGGGDDGGGGGGGGGSSSSSNHIPDNTLEYTTEMSVCRMHL